MSALRIVAAATTCLLLLALPVVNGAADDTTRFPPEYEQRVGAQAAAEVEAQYARYDDEEAHAKIAAMVAEIAAASGRPDVEYDVRLIDTDEVNAFSLPGGIIYVTRGLLSEVQSDDELAGVLAHEIAHNCTYDALIQAERNRELFTGSVAATIAAILLGGSSDTISTVLIAGEYIRTGVLGGYSIDIEAQADRHAVEYLLKTSYNPMGLLTFMGRLAAQWRRDPQVDPGIFRTHPDPDDRVYWLRDELYEAGVDMNPRATTQWEPPKAEEVEADGQTVTHVVLWGEEIFRVMVPGPEAETPLARAEAIAARLTSLLADGLQRYELGIGDHDGNPALEANGEVILTVYPEDAQAQGAEQEELARRAQTALMLALRTEELDWYW